MHEMLEWSDFQIVLAIHRAGTLSDAARLLKVNQSTISRALQRIESRAKVRVFFSLSGRYQITSEGLRFLRLAETFDKAFEEFSKGEFTSEAVKGVVRITSIESFITGYLIDKLPKFRERFPDIGFELNGSNETMDLLKRGYDVSLRMDRERKAGTLIQRKIAEFGVSTYTKAASGEESRKRLVTARDWIGYETALSEIPEETWLRKRFRKHVPSIRVGSYLSMERAIEKGLGVGLLPCFIGDRNPKLQKVGGPSSILTRSIWLISHPEARRQSSVDCFVRWLMLELESSERELLGMA